jgi:tetratricopeptide (TPR) repeat protein/predicted aspartyl protease
MVAVLAPALLVSGTRAATCKLQAAELQVTMNGLRPMVHAKINGNDVQFLADSGAFYSMLSRGPAEQYKLSLQPPPAWFVLSGVGGEARAWLTKVKTFTLLNLPIPNVEFVVTENDFGGGAVGLLGQNVFRLIGDVEYDLANGVIRLVSTHDCEKSPLAYWAKSQPYSVINIEHATPASLHTAGVAYLNGAKIRVVFDTGAAASVLTLAAAKRAGLTPQSEGVVPAGETYGIGRRVAQTWIAPFASFKIGDEEIRNTHLRIGAVTIDVDMLIGADFFLSHRVYVANSQNKLYFTYNGGPVFNLTTSPEQGGGRAPVPPGGAPAPAAAGDAGTSSQTPVTPGAALPRAPAAPATAGAAPSGAPSPDESTPQPSDASGFARRGAAFAARHDFGHAIADLTHACELAPQESSYFYERAMAYWGNQQPELAMADLNHALTLDPRELPALVARADLHLRHDEVAAAITDLDAADRAAPRQADVRLHLADQYLFAGQLAAAVSQATLWIDAHQRDDVQMPRARNLRCWARALSGEQLDQALGDCNIALRTRPDTAAFFDSRGLVYLRRGEYDRAIADYDRALALRSNDAWSYYGRGVAKLRKRLTAEGQADIAAAKALRPNIAEDAAKHGVRP